MYDRIKSIKKNTVLVESNNYIYKKKEKKGGKLNKNTIKQEIFTKYT